MFETDPLALFYRGMLESFNRAAASPCPASKLKLQIGAHALHISIAGEGLLPIILPAFSHLISDEENSPALEIFIWDEKSTGVSLPPQPWDISAVDDRTSFVFPSHPRYEVSLNEERNVLMAADRKTHTTVLWVKHCGEVFTYHYASPFLNLLKNEVLQFGMGIVHAGCVGDDRGAVLLVGKGGSGKSTTALLSTLWGLNYLSDDYCLVEFGDSPTAYCLFNSGKLHIDHLKRFPELERLAVNPRPDRYEKPIIFMNDHFPGKVAHSRKLKAVIAPVVTGEPDTRLTHLGKTEALKALALSTLFQLKTNDPGFLNKLGSLVQRLPCYRLELGTDVAQIPPIIHNLLQRSAQ